MKPSRSVYAQKLNDFPQLVFADDAIFSQRGQWSDYFRNRIGPLFDGKIIFEVGCFDASFLAAIAAENPTTGFVGLDWKCKAIFDGAHRVSNLGLKNIALLRGRAQNVRRIFGDKEVNEIWVFHPDPCDRDVELKNRLIAEPFMLDVACVLKDAESILALKTDHLGYYQWVLGMFGVPHPDPIDDAVSKKNRNPQGDLGLLQQFAVSISTADFWHDPSTLAHTAKWLFAHHTTAFENRFRKKRQPIHYVEIRRK